MPPWRSYGLADFQRALRPGGENRPVGPCKVPSPSATSTEDGTLTVTASSGWSDPKREQAKILASRQLADPYSGRADRVTASLSIK